MFLGSDIVFNIDIVLVSDIVLDSNFMLRLFVISISEVISFDKR